MCKLQSHFRCKMKKIWIAFALLLTSYVAAQQNQEKCNLPEGKYIAWDVPMDEWMLEIKGNQLKEIIHHGEIVIYSTYTKVHPNDCEYLMTVQKIEGDEPEIKVGDKYITTVKDIIDNYLYIRTETQKTGMELILLKQK